MVTADPAQAVEAAVAGERVVLVALAIAPTVRDSAGLAVMIGDPADPAVWAAAEEMDRELAGR